MNRKYLVIAHNYYPAVGGAEKLLQSIAENIDRKGLDVEVLTSNAKSTEAYFSKNPETIGAEKEVINNIVVYRENVVNFAQRFGNTFKNMVKSDFAAKGQDGDGGAIQACGIRRWFNDYLKLCRGLLLDFAPLLMGPHFLKFFCKYLFGKKEYTHIVCGPFPTSVPFYACLLKLFKPSVKLILVPCIHVNEPLYTGRMLRFVARRADKVLVLTLEEAIFLESVGVKAENIVETGAGVDAALLSREQKNSDFTFRYLLFLGQDVPHKNIIQTIDAMGAVWKYDRDLKLVIAGARTGYSRVINEYIDNLNGAAKEKIIRITDFDDNKKIELLDNCEMLVMPSSHESFGLVFIEAWSRKKPVIGADVPAVRYLIEDKCDGLLCKDKSAADLAEKILYLLNNPEKCKAFGEAGYRKVMEKYSWDVVINKILEAC